MQYPLLVVQGFRIGPVSAVNVFGKLWFSLGQRVFKSVSFWLFKVGSQLFGVLASSVFWSLSKIELSVKILSV